MKVAFIWQQRGFAIAKMELLDKHPRMVGLPESA
jgi:hypothetical protein